MNLILDIGNTLIKFAVFQEDKLLEKKIAKNEDAPKILQLFLKERPSLKKAIICAVGKLDIAIVDALSGAVDLLILDHSTQLPFKNSYLTPRTLGVDRIALVSAAVKHHPSSNVLVIDAGTCITYDFITADADYLGGAISPGLRLRYASLNILTANLPLLDTHLPGKLIGDSTSSAIHSGVVLGAVKEIDGLIAEYKERYEDLTVILTGGDADFLSKQLKNGIFANSNFLLEGLNYILEFNSH